MIRQQNNPMPAAEINTGLRPIRPISKEAGNVVNIDTTYISDMGKVASHGSGAIRTPTRLVTMILIFTVVIKQAWDNASRAILRPFADITIPRYCPLMPKALMGVALLLFVRVQQRFHQGNAQTPCAHHAADD